MNAKLLYAATIIIALISSTAAMASEATEFVAGPGSRTRAEVQAELDAARSAGQLDQRGESYGSFQPGSGSGSTLTRAEVLADAARSRAQARHGASDRAYGYPEPQTAGTRSRDEVRAEARLAARARIDSPKVSD